MRFIVQRVHAAHIGIRRIESTGDGIAFKYGQAADFYRADGFQSAETNAVGDHRSPKASRAAGVAPNLKNRKEIIALLHALPHAAKTADDELLFFIEKHKLHGLGIGLIDAHLLSSCKLSNMKLLTRDKRLRNAARQLNVLAE